MLMYWNVTIKVGNSLKKSYIFVINRFKQFYYFPTMK